MIFAAQFMGAFGVHKARKRFRQRQRRCLTPKNLAAFPHHFVPRGVEQLLLPVVIEAHIVPVGVHNRVLPLEIALAPRLLVVARPLRHRPLICDEHKNGHHIRRARKKPRQCLFCFDSNSAQIRPQHLPTSRRSNKSGLWFCGCYREPAPGSFSPRPPAPPPARRPATESLSGPLSITSPRLMDLIKFEFN